MSLYSWDFRSWCWVPTMSALKIYIPLVTLFTNTQTKRQTYTNVKTEGILSVLSEFLVSSSSGPRKMPIPV